MKHLFAAIALISITISIAVSIQAAPQQQGLVRFGEVPVPGASVQALRSTQTDNPLRTITNAEGRYTLPDLAPGLWTIEVRAPGFVPVRREVMIAVTISEDTQADELLQWDLKMLSIDDVKGIRALNGGPATGFPKSPSGVPILQTQAPEAETADRLLINGTVSNGASTPFALPRALGNNRRGIRLYTGSVLITGNNALFDARSLSLTGQDTPKPAYNRLQSGITAGGPFQIPGLFRRGNFSLTYSRTQNSNATLQTVQVPTAAERAGNFSQNTATLIDPLTGAAFAGNVIPAGRISPQAKALADLYPQPNFGGPGRYNYQIPVLGITHGDNFQGGIQNIAVTRKDRVSGIAGIQSTRSDNPDLFGFTDTANNSTAAVNLNWNHQFSQRVSGVVRYQFMRTVAETLPYFGNRLDVSGNAGISGNDRDPRNWGPPALNFAGGIARLASGSYGFDRSQSSMVAYTSNWIRGRHSIAYGADYRRQQFNLLSQRDARGSFTFTGAATGIDFADFLLGTPTASSLAFGNADKYFRQSFSSAFVTDDFHLKSKITLTLGVRWEYESPITELYGRLVNLHITPGFGSAAPVIAGTSSEALVQTDKSGIQPRLALAWRPKVASSMVVRAGYGVYRDTNVYRAIADQMSQQSPLSKSLSVQNTPLNPLTLADGFRGSPAVTATTFAIDPHFRVGNAQNWNLAVQRDLPFSMQATVTYLGIKGTHVPQRVLPNTFPAGAVNPCPGCPAGFVYLTSDGNTSRNAGTIELRRRQRNGFEASARYTFAKAIDDAGLGGSNHIVQNWLDRRAERGLSDFDQRHQLVAQGQYTTGSFNGIGTFWDGWRGKVFKEWTLSSQLTIGSGSPLTPVILAPVSGTGVTGTLRPDVTGAPIAVDGVLNPSAFALPAPGQWGNAARNSIIGPRQFALNASLLRTFRVSDRISMDLKVDATNVLNHVTFPRWNTTVNSAQYGLPVNANAMRVLQPSLRVRF